MSVALHILKKDLRAFWPWLCVVFAFLVLRAWQLWHDPTLGIYHQFFMLAIFNYVVLELFLIAVLVRLVQEDSLVGTSAFWLTRPISRKSLLLSKLVFSVLFIFMAPVAANFLVLFHYGLEASQVPSALVAVVGPHLVILCACACLAVLTPNLSTFAVAAAALLVCQFSVNNLFPLPVLHTAWASGPTILAVLVLIITFGVAVHQYLTRKTRHSIAMLVAGILLVWVGFYSSIWDTILPSTSVIQASERAVSAIEFIVNRETFKTADYHPPPYLRSGRPIFGTLSLMNILDSEEIVLTGLSGHLKFQNGEEISSQRAAWVSFGNAMQRSLPGFEGTGPDVTSSVVELLEVPENQYSKYCNQKGIYTGEAKFDIYRDEAIAEVPLIAGSRLSIGSTEMLIANVENTDGGKHLHVFLDSRSLAADSGLEGFEFNYCVLNRSRRQTLNLFRAGGDVTSGQRIPLLLPGIDLSHWTRRLDYTAPDSPGAATLVDDSWMSEARLMVLKRVYLGRFSRNFEIRGFSMADYTLEKWQERK